MISYSKRDYFYKDSVFKDWRIVCKRDNTTIATITNKELREESITITESLDSSEDLIFGRCEPSKLEFEVHNIIQPLKGCTVTVDLILDHDTSAPFRVGTYFVDSDKPTANRDFRTVVCYDAAGKLGEMDITEWYDTLRFPMSLKNFRNSFFSYVGITQETVSLINDNINIYKGLNDDSDDSSRSTRNSSLSAMNVLNAICELNGCFGHINRNNKFVYVYLPVITKGLYPADDLYPANDLYPADDVVGGTFYPKYYTSCEYEDFEVKAIDDVIVYGDDSSVEVRVNQNGTNPYILEDNFLLYKMSTNELRSVANNLYSKINFVIYSPCSIECVADLCIEVGDSYLFNDKYNQIYSYVMTRTMKGLQVLKDSLESRGNEDRTKNLNNLDSKISRAESKAEYDSKEIKDTVTHFENLTANRFEADEAKITNLEVDTLDVKVKLTAARADITALYAEDAVINGTLTAHTANINTLNTDVADIKTLKADKATVNSLSASFASFKTLTTQQLDADDARIRNLIAQDVTINGKITAAEGNISTLNTKVANIEELKADKATVNTLSADLASFKTLTTNKFTADEGKIGTLEADMVTVKGNISTINGDISSINGSISTVNGDIVTINGNISAVNGRVDVAAAGIAELNATKATIDQLNAVTISADRIVSGTISADRISADVLAQKLTYFTHLTGASVHTTQGLSTNGHFSCGGISIGSYTCSFQTITVGGTQYTVLCG
ncbi:MAG: hypothetical protein J6Y02_06660 [Pseudobutyrivibrio sp.]|nr:hypothetical protein [Pseudobutyrivibrio sp.]